MLVQERLLPGELALVRIELGVEIVQAALEELRGEHRVDFHLGSLQRHAGLAGEYQQFAKGVAAGKVGTGVGLGETLALGTAEDVGKGLGAVALITGDYQIEGAGHHGLDCGDLLAPGDGLEYG